MSSLRRWLGRMARSMPARRMASSTRSTRTALRNGLSIPARRLNSPPLQSARTALSTSAPTSSTRSGSPDDRPGGDSGIAAGPVVVAPWTLRGDLDRLAVVHTGLDLRELAVRYADLH